WLLRITRHIAMNYRRASRQSFVEMDVDQIAVPEGQDPAAAAALRRAIATLPVDDRRLCERYYHGGWTTARLASAEAIGEAAIRKRLQRIRDRLRNQMSMPTTDLPERIVEMLSKPNLTNLPENPVGAIWESFRDVWPGFEVVELSEELEPAQLRRVLVDATASTSEGHLATVEEYIVDRECQQMLRTDLTVPMLLAAVDAPLPTKRITTGKTYRMGDVGEEETSTRLRAFHQAEALWIEEGINEWQIMGPMTQFIETLCEGARVRLLPVDFLLYCDRAWTVEAQTPAQDWFSVAGWGRLRPEIVSNLGHDPDKATAVAVGMGLERLAMLRYGIDDIRRVAAERV
ncbi:MAG: hypothetical protein HN712_28800, partial [Gemmatimonadetes bacterium]|nr:hypothetical protein [Gemmatimonadota bacterium]